MSKMKNHRTLLCVSIVVMMAMAVVLTQCRDGRAQAQQTAAPSEAQPVAPSVAELQPRKSDGAGMYELLTPQNSALILIDHQPQMAFGVQSIDRQTLLNNVTGLAKSSKVFNVPTILTTVAEKTFSGPIFPQIKEVYPDLAIIDRTSMN